MNLDFESGSEIATAIDNRIIQLAKYVFRQSPYNKIKYGIVEKIDGKKYTVMIDNKQYTMNALKNIGTINLTDKVVVMIPNNEYSNMFIIGVLDTD